MKLKHFEIVTVCGEKMDWHGRNSLDVERQMKWLGYEPVRIMPKEDRPYESR